MKHLEKIVMTALMIMTGLGMMASIFMSGVTHNVMWFIVTFLCGTLFKTIDDYNTNRIED